METSPDCGPPITTAEAGRRLNCSARHVRRLVDSGLLTAVWIGPHLLRCRPEEVDAMALGQPLSVSGIPSQRSTR